MTERAKPTPGPWTVVGDDQIGRDIAAGRNRVAWSCYGDMDACVSTITAADARLIAAAPELAEALRDLREAATEAYKAGRIQAEPFVRAGNVLAKAEGK